MSTLPTQNSEGLKGLLSAVLAETGVIQAADNGVDGRANNLMAAALVIIALLGTQLRDSQHGTWHWWTVAAMVAMIADVFLVIYLTRTQKYAQAAVDLHKHRDYFAKDDELLLAQLIEDAALANEYNTAILEGKERLSGRAVILFLVGFALGLTALVTLQT